MDCAWSVKGLILVALTGLIFSAAPTASMAADARSQPRGFKSNEKLTLPQAVAIAVIRNLRVTDARLDVQEKEHVRREAYSDFFPSVDIEYSATWYRYMQQGNVQALAGNVPSRWTVRGDPTQPTGFLIPDYPYRIDPFRFFTLTATMTQPLFTGGRLINEYKFARLGVDYSAIQYEVTIQDLTLDVNQAYYQLVQAQKLLEVAEQSIRALEALRNQTV